MRCSTRTDLVLRRQEIVQEARGVEDYLDLAGCEGEEREHVKVLAPPGYRATLGWFLLTRA